MSNPPPYLRHFEFQSAENPEHGSLVISETSIPDRVQIFVTGEMFLSESQFRSLRDILSYSSGQALRFQPPETTEEDQDNETN